MKKSFLFLFAAVAIAAASFAQTDENAASSAATPRPAKHRHSHHTAATAAVSPTPTPTPQQSKSRTSWFSGFWPFHRKIVAPQATPAPSASASPSPTPHKRRSVAPKSGASPAAVAVSTEEKKSAEKNAPAENPAPAKKTASAPDEEAAASPTPSLKKGKKSSQQKTGANTLKSDQVPFVSQPSSAPNAGATAPENAQPKTIGGGISSAEEDAKEHAHFQQIKTQALEDKKIRELQDKADNAQNDDEQRKASKEYYKALYGKMRKLDPSLKEHIDRVENVTIKRLDQPGNSSGQ